MRILEVGWAGPARVWGWRRVLRRAGFFRGRGGRSWAEALILLGHVGLRLGVDLRTRVPFRGPGPAGVAGVNRRGRLFVVTGCLGHRMVIASKIFIDKGFGRIF